MEQFSLENIKAEQVSISQKQLDQQCQFTMVQIPEPSAVEIFENSPNPFCTQTNIQFSIATREFVSVRIINPLGREICTLFTAVADANRVYEIEFNASHLPSAVYFCLLQTRRDQKIIRMVLSK